MYDESIGKKIRELRVKKNWSQEDLAFKLDKSGNSSISKIENGTQSLTASELKKISLLLDTTPNELLGVKNETTVSSYYSPVINKEVCINKFEYNITKIEWMFLYIAILIPFSTILFNEFTSYIILSILSIILTIIFIKVILDYIFKKNRHVLKIQTEIGNNIVYSSLWEEDKIKEYLEKITFMSLLGCVFSFLYIIGFSSVLENINQLNSWISIGIIFILMLPSFIRLNQSMNFKKNQTIDYKDNKDKSLALYFCLLINFSSLYFLGFLNAYQKNLDGKLFNKNILINAACETIITLILVNFQKKYMSNFDVFILDNKKNTPFKISIDSYIE